MKIRNIAQISILMAFLASTQSNCMLVAAARKLIKTTGTIVGVGLPTAPFVIAAIEAAQQVAQNPEASFPDAQPLPADHEAFYRKTVGDTVKLKYIPDSEETRSFAVNSGNLIVMPEKIYTKDGAVSLQEALETNNTKALAAFEGTLEHEYGHHLHKDVYKKCAEIGGVPIATTALAALLFRRAIPATTTLPKEVVRSATKVLAGEGLIKVNQEAVNLYSAYASRKKEFAADQNVSQKNREAFIEDVEIIENAIGTKLAKKQYPNLSDSEHKEIGKKILAAHYQSPYATHRSPEARKKALGVYTSSQTISGQYNNKL